MKQIGPYELMEELGQGGMGIVYRARQASLNRLIALKVLPEHLAGDATALRRFRQEAETAARLRHQNIVTVYEASVESPPYFIAMEFLEGRTLGDLITARGRLDPTEAAELFKQICSALDHAHDKSIVHRDIKPANIIVSDQGRAVLTDFGIARASDQTRLTATGAVFGSPDYMSPEQAKGLPIDHRTDIYSAGALLFEMLTGRTPYGGGESLTVMYRIVNEEPPSPRSICPDISPAIEAVIARAMQKDPRNRFASCGEMSFALENALRQPAGGEAAYAPPAKTLAVSGLDDKLAGAPGGGRAVTAARRPWPAFAAIGGLVVVGLALFLVPAFKKEAKTDPVKSSPANTEKSASAKGPQVAGMSAGQAKAAIQAAGFAYAEAAKVFSDATPRGFVISQNPPVNGKVAVVLSLGQGVAVPPVSGLSKSSAVSALAGANLQCGTVSAIASKSVPPGVAIGSKPAAGQTVPQGSAVKLLISSGRPIIQAPRYPTSPSSYGSSSASSAAPAPGQKTYACPVCGKTFPSAKKRNEHAALHALGSLLR